MNVIRPFGPTIAKVSMSENLVKELNDYVDKTLVDKKKTEELNYGKMLAGNVQQEFLLDKEFIVLSGWESFLKENAEKWIFESTKKKIEEFKIIDTWIVRQFENDIILYILMADIFQELDISNYLNLSVMPFNQIKKKKGLDTGQQNAALN